MAHQRYGIQPDSVNLTIVNASGATIYHAILPVREIAQVATSTVDDTSAAKLVQAQLPMDGLHLTSVDINTDANGARVLTLHLGAQDVAAANLAIPQFMPDLFRFLDELNSVQAMQITICNVYLVDSKGELLLKYVRDIALAQENWWQADGLSQGWFTVPAPPTVP